jgi:ketosteroid isomerase-like protein
MKHLIIIIFIGAFTISCSDMDSKKAAVDLVLEKEKVALVLEKYVIANEEQRISLVKEVWASKPDIVVFGTNSDETIIGWEAIRLALKKQFENIENTYISVRDQRIEVNETGNTAWFSEIVNYNYIYLGKPVKYEGLRFTGVLEKINGEWLIVQSHMSIPGKPE